MSTKDCTPDAASAPSVVRDTADREYIKDLATDASFVMLGDCEHCGGTGRSRTIAERMVHCFGPYWFGENWDLARLHAAIDSAAHIRWVDDPAGRDLVIVLDGEVYQFQVKYPAQAESAA